MKNKKILGVAMAAMVTATMVSSCIETDEPAGIEKLRTAKAEFIAAEAAYKTAQISLVTAEAALMEIEVKSAEVDLALKQAETEAEIENAKQALEVAKKQLAVAQHDHEVALKEIEIANAAALDPDMTMYDDYRKAYNSFKSAKNAYLGYMNGTYFVNGTSQILVKKQEALVEAQEELAKVMSQDYNANDNATKYKWDVIAAEKLYNQVKANVDFLTSMEFLDSAVVVERTKELIEQSFVLDAQEAKLEIELAELQNVEAHKKDAYEEATKAYNDEVTTPLYDAMKAAELAYEDAKEATADKKAEIDAVNVESEYIDDLLDVYLSKVEDNMSFEEMKDNETKSLEEVSNDLDDAKAKLAAFENGDLDKSTLVKDAEKDVEEAEEAVADAEVANNEAKAEYDEAKAIFDKIYAIVSAE